MPFDILIYTHMFSDRKSSEIEYPGFNFCFLFQSLDKGVDRLLDDEVLDQICSIMGNNDVPNQTWSITGNNDFPDQT